MKEETYHDYIIYDVFEGVKEITSRKMFGGWGIYKGGTFFALVSDGELYFKVDKATVKDYEERGAHPFTYEKKGKKITLSYWLVPEEILENKEILHEWIENAVDAQTRSKK